MMLTSIHHWKINTSARYAWLHSEIQFKPNVDIVYVYHVSNKSEGKLIFQLIGLFSNKINIFFNYSGNWYFRCPVDNTWSNHVFDDNACKREVLSLKVECLYSDNKCTWSGELRELQVI